jgi:fumarate reductase flavoprotein subunit
MSAIVRADTDFEMEVPVVVVGAGASGLTAALAARDAGADVLLLERDLVPRGSTSMSQGYVCAAGTRLQKEAGIEDGPDHFYRDIMDRTKNTADPLVARTVADHAGSTVDWLVEKFDIPFRMNLPWAGFFGHTVNRMHGMPSRTGEELHGALISAADRIGVDTIAGAHVDTVYADDQGRVHGIGFRRPDGTQERVGCSALVLATCGFGANIDMVRKFIPSFGNAPYYKYHGHEGNEGEGIAWGMELGGAVGNMDAFQGYGALAEKYGIIVNYDMVMKGGITVNLLGERFSNEIEDISGQAINVLRQPGGQSWIIFDDQRRKLVENFPEYRDLSALGAVRSGSTAEELAAAINVPADALVQTFASVERMVRGEIACPFGRSFAGNAPLSPPYHAISSTGALFHTQGGLQVDGDAQVVGGAARSISGGGPSGYLPAAGLCTAVTLGRLAGISAAALSQSPR